MTTVIYIRGQDERERRANLIQTMQAAGRKYGERWLARPDFEQNIQTAHERVEETTEPINLEESSLEEPLGQIWISHDRPGSRGGLTALIDWVEEIDQTVTVVVPDMDHLVDQGTGTERLERLLNAGADVHCCDSGVEIARETPIEGKTRRVVRTLAESVSGSVKTGDTYRHKGGRPPLGYRAEDGELVPDHDGEPSYERVCDILQQVADGHVSKRKAADALDCARATVGNCLERPDMYQLQ